MPKAIPKTQFRLLISVVHAHDNMGEIISDTARNDDEDFAKAVHDFILSGPKNAL